jgi:hypothetical protein
MTEKLLLSTGIVFALFAAWVLVAFGARAYAKRHPEFGPPREEGGECGVSCGCTKQKSCATFQKGNCKTPSEITPKKPGT